MRRSDREVKDIDEIEKIIQSSNICRLAIFDDEYPYIVALNFGYLREKDQFTFYFHSAKEGKKIDLLKKNANVCLQLDAHHELTFKNPDIACTYSYKYHSIIAFGKIDFIEDEQEKEIALRLLMKQHSDRDNFHFTKEMFQMVQLYKCTVHEISAKKQ